MSNMVYCINVYICSAAQLIVRKYIYYDFFFGVCELINGRFPPMANFTNRFCCGLQ